MVKPSFAITFRALLPIRLLLALCLGLGLATVSSADQHGGDAAEVKGLFVVVTSADPQTQLMAMVLSTQAKAKGKSVRLLLCGPGGDLALQEGEETRLKPRDVSPQMLMGKLMADGVQVEVCAIYLPNKGVGAEALRPGITAAKPPAIADALLAPGIKLFTF